MVLSKESDHQRTRWCREQRVWNMHINPKKPLASAHLLFAGIDGNVVKRGDVFARRVFCGKSAIHLFSTIMNSTVRWHPRGAGETGALTEKDPVLCGVRPPPLLGGEAHACLCCQTPVFWLRLLTASVTEGSDMRSAYPEAYTWQLPAGAPPPLPTRLKCSRCLPCFSFDWQTPAHCWRRPLCEFSTLACEAICFSSSGPAVSCGSLQTKTDGADWC